MSLDDDMMNDGGLSSTIINDHSYSLCSSNFKNFLSKKLKERYGDTVYIEKFDLFYLEVIKVLENESNIDAVTTELMEFLREFHRQCASKNGEVSSGNSSSGSGIGDDINCKFLLNDDLEVLTESIKEAYYNESLLSSFNGSVNVLNFLDESSPFDSYIKVPASSTMTYATEGMSNPGSAYLQSDTNSINHFAASEITLKMEALSNSATLMYDNSLNMENCNDVPERSINGENALLEGGGYHNGYAWENYITSDDYNKAIDFDDYKDVEELESLIREEEEEEEEENGDNITNGSVMHYDGLMQWLQLLECVEGILINMYGKLENQLYSPEAISCALLKAEGNVEKSLLLLFQTQELVDNTKVSFVFCM